MFQNVKAMRVSDLIVSQIQNMVVNGELQEGEKLPNETELSRQFGVSRASVREALTSLESKGVVERHKNEGTTLCRHSLEKILSAIDLPKKSDRMIFEDLYEARELFEIKAAELACQRADEMDLIKIRKTLELLRQSIERGESGIEPDILFHECITAATKNHVMAGIDRSMNNMLRDMRAQTLAVPGRLVECLEEHKKIYEAIAAGDAELCGKLMHQHFAAVRDIRSKIGV